MADGHMPERGEKMVGPITEVGTDFIINPAGLIVTNRHVVQDAYRITVTPDGGDTYAGQVLAINDAPDLAPLKIDAAVPLPTVPFGDSDALAVGDAMMTNSIQTDAAINLGNSGGPLLNMKGEVVGVNWALMQPQREGGSLGLGLAIPSDTAAFVVSHMRHYGHMRPGWIGVDLQSATQDVARTSGLTTRDGSIVTNVMPGGPAADVLRLGAIVLAFGGRPTPYTRALSRAIAGTEPGSTAAIKLWRDGQDLDSLPRWRTCRKGRTIPRETGPCPIAATA